MYAGGIGIAEAKRLEEVLGELLSVPGILGVTVVSPEGLPVAHLSRSGAREKSVIEASAALLAMALSAAQRAADGYESGKVQQLTIEAEHHVILVRNYGHFVLSIQAEKEALLGRLRYELERIGERVRRLL